MWPAEYNIMKLYRSSSSSSVECAICFTKISHRPQTRSSNMGTSDFWHTCTDERNICLTCMKKSLENLDTCPLCRKKIQSRVSILSQQDFGNFDRFYTESTKKGGFYYRIPSNWEYFDEKYEDEYLGLKGPANTLQDLKQFLLNFMRKHELQNLKIRIDDSYAELTNGARPIRR